MPVTDDVVPTIRTLLRRADLRLHLLTGDDDPALDRDVRWVHSSDLADPTPFLADDLVLLTTGTQFTGDDAISADDYVARLVSRGVLGLGFGTEVVRAGVPDHLISECRRRGLPLFQVPYGTPFIALARANAEAVAAQAFARRTWALAAQRAIALAALRPDGLGATVVELSKQLGTWVGLYDSAGSLLREHGVIGTAHTQLDDEVAAVLRRGARAASALSIDGAPFTVQTLGRGGRLRGVIAIASAELDQEGRGVVTSVIAMAGLALEQQQRLQRGRAALRAGLVRLLESGDTPLARRVAREIGSPLPPAPVQIAVISGTGRHFNMLERLDLLTAEEPGSVFFARTDDDLVVIVPDGSGLPADLATRFDVGVGLSERGGYGDISVLLAQARTARDSARGAVAPFADVRSFGMFAAPSEQARAVAASLLAPLDGREELLTTLRAFFEADGSNEATAVAIGVHRHTVRARLQAVQKALNVDLASFAVRAELWAALRTTQQ